jgi:hypothetical protein
MVNQVRRARMSATFRQFDESADCSHGPAARVRAFLHDSAAARPPDLL